MDISSQIQEVLGKIMEDDSLKSKLKENPIGTIESLIGRDLPDDQIKAVADAVLAKIGIEDAGDALDKLKKLF